MNKNEALYILENAKNEKENGIIEITHNGVTYHFVNGHNKVNELETLLLACISRKTPIIKFKDMNNSYSIDISGFKHIVGKFRANLSVIAEEFENRKTEINGSVLETEWNTTLSNSWTTSYSSEINLQNSEHVAFDWKSTWSSSTIYETNDVVLYKGSSYICINDHTSNSTFDVTKWDIMAKGQNLEFVDTTPLGDSTSKTVLDGMFKVARTIKGRGGAWSQDPDSEWRMAVQNELMSWEIIGTKGNPIDNISTNRDAFKSTATDGDIDIAYAMLQASYKWGGNAYDGTAFSVHAVNRAKAVRQFDAYTNTTPTAFKRISLGSWAADGTGNLSTDKHYGNTRSSDWIPAAMTRFSTIDTTAVTSRPTWTEILSDLQTKALPRLQNATTGLFPDFGAGEPLNPVTSSQVTPWLESAHDGKFYANACRTPWRLAQGWHHESLTWCRDAVTKYMDWLVVKTGNNPENMNIGYNLDGTEIPNPTEPLEVWFVAPSLIAGTISASYQTWTNNAYEMVRNYDRGDGYYSHTLGLLALIYVTGNWWNPKGVIGSDYNFPTAGRLNPEQPIYGPTGYTQDEMNRHVMDYYKKWKKQYLIPTDNIAGGYYIDATGTGTAGNSLSHSEAHGYGMMIFALMGSSNGWDGTYDLVGPKGDPGPKGDKGDTGTSLNIKGVVTAINLLPGGAASGDCYMLNENLMVYDGTKWVNCGRILGAKGDKGDKGSSSIKDLGTVTTGFDPNDLSNYEYGVINVFQTGNTTLGSKIPFTYAHVWTHYYQNYRLMQTAYNTNASGGQFSRSYRGDTGWSAWVSVKGDKGDQGDPGTSHTVFTNSTDGLVPKPTVASGKFLKDDGTWATVSGGGGSLSTYNNDNLLTATTSSLNFGRGLDARVTGNDVRIGINPFNYIWYVEDFLDYLVGSRLFNGAVIASGTMAAASTTLDDGTHPGIVRMTSSTTANSGGRLAINATSLLLRAGYKFRSVVRFPSITTTTVRMGFIDTTTNADCVDGLYFEILNGVATFKTSSNSSRTSSSSTYTMAINTWYEVRIELTESNTAIGTIISNTGTVLFTSNAISTTIPTTSGRQTGCGLIYTNSGTTAIEGVQVDYLALQIPESTASFRQMW